MTEEEELNKAWEEVDRGIYQIKLQIKIRELEKIIEYYEKKIYPFACYDPEYVSHEQIKDVHRVNLLLTHSEAIQEYNKLKAFYDLKYRDDNYARKLRQLTLEE